MMEYKLQDLIDIQQFQMLQDRLNEIYSFPSAIIDNDGNILTATAWQDICTKFHRVNEDSKTECLKSDQYILSHLHEANPAVSYRCPHGLIDNAIPIIIEGVHYGNFFTGQFFLEKPDNDFFRKQAKKFGFDEAAYLDAVKKVPVWTQEQLDSYLFFIKGLIDVISGIGLKNLREIEAKKQLQEKEEYATTILSGMFDGYWVVDMQGQILDANEAICRLVGYSREELLTMSLGDIVKDESPEFTAGRIQEIIHNGTAYFQTKFHCKDGGIINTDVSVRYLPEKNLMIAFHRDITDKMRAEEALRDNEARLNTILDNVGAYIFIKDTQYRYIYANNKTCELFGKKQEDIVGHTDADFFSAESVAELMKSDRPVIEEGKTTNREEQDLTSQDKVPRSYWTIKLPLHDSRGTITGLCGISADITERKKIEEEKTRLKAQLRQAQKMEAIGTLAGGIAHDFNNILAAIMGFTEIAITELPVGHPAHNELREVVAASKRAKELVKQILAFSRRTDQELKEIAPCTVVAEAMKLLRASIPTTIEFQTNIDPKSGTILADPTQVHQIIVNLCTNAYQAMEDKGGTLKVEVVDVDLDAADAAIIADLRPGPYVQMTVSDTGFGIQEDIKEKIFDPYFTTKELGKGSGMGLSVVHGIIKAYGGAIRVDSQEGEGSAFSVFLPRIGANGKAKIAEKMVLPTGKERIMLVDDERPIRQMYTRSLQRLGYRVTSFGVSRDALNAFTADPDFVDLVITDQTMPAMTGAVLAKELMKIKPELPVILATGYSSSIDASAAKKLGIRAFALKPLNLKELAVLVRQALDA